MGKKKTNGDYNDFLDGEKLRDNAEIRASLQNFASRDIPPPPARQDRRGSKKKGKGGPKKPPLTHFLCLPLITDTSRPQIQRGLEKLKQELGHEGLVPPKAVRPVGTLHLTLGVMSLDAPTLLAAQQYLRNLDLHVLLRDVTHRRVAEKAAEEGAIAENLNAATMPDTDALTINLEALIPMQAPHKTSILYAEPQDVSQRLQPFAAALRSEFTERKFLLEDTRPLKLHATVLNTIHAKSGGRRGRGKGGKLKDGIQHVKQKVSPHRQESSTYDADAQQDDDAAASTTGLVDDSNTVPPDPSTAEEPPASRNEGHGPDAKGWLRFDARSLIADYKGFEWARDVKVDRVYICKMGAKKIWSGGKDGVGEVVDERYEVVAEKGIFE